MKMHFVYKTINIITQQFYIGVHSTTNIDDGYLGSGDRIKKSIKKYGKQNFTRVIIEQCVTRAAALIIESQLVTQELIDDPLCLNITIGGKGNPNSSITRSDETKRKTSESLKGRPSPNKGRQLSQQHKDKIKSSSLNVLNRHTQTNETRRKISLAKTGSIPHNKGIPMSNELKLKHSLAKTDKMRPVSIQNTIYNSVADACKALRLHRSTIMNRLNSEHWHDWFYITEASNDPLCDQLLQDNLVQ